ncbi:hypothetical protein WJ0W_003279 [Paenibacillus melissococcoides]|uniref:Uncharacterized protein n=1 Tax=Paenibacillus melissococcoides TaxID=2912268 RepID=A0ABM9G2Z8_9BACL|nr:MULTISPECIES: hypothetical protein [Paenibacillus]MEB9893285.1 hypothetical protein [Bacillus cereus]CAH8246042.1 hypothetical protein WJ0W_003279 [Paenibacillus melissococcoides]CAH8712800.1 hypothetical protein WDD9_003358 [Paenibacillus melissococcoides]CAH8713569.1 hypothetical protein HTL2_003661 [Paenibacillus melissococcoides]GIO78764.1 hypothetical protein J6TS7_23740 [Paenibacillus dendritiformis]
MSIFKDAVAHDIASVFLNFDEFGEYRSIGGQKILIVEDRDLISERPGLSSAIGKNVTAEGVYLSVVTFFVRMDDLGYVPVEGQDMRYGEVGKREYPYFVTNVSEAMGILEVTIEANRS